MPVEPRHPVGEERPREEHVALLVPRDQPQHLPGGLVAALLQMAQAEVQIELVVEAAERGHHRLHRQVGIEGHLGEGMIARPRDGLARNGLVAAEQLGEEEARLEVLGLLGGAEGQEELGVHARGPGLEAEANQERRVLAEPGVGAPGPPAPHEARRLAHGMLIRRGIEAAPRDVRLGVPAQPLGLRVQLAQGRALGCEAQREAPLHEALLLGLKSPQQLVARL